MDKDFIKCGIMRNIHCSVLFVLYMLVTLASCKMDGPPLEACISMRPGTEQGALNLIGHVQAPQNEQYNGDKCPFHILVYHNDDYYQPDQEITVSVVADQTRGMAKYRGLLMQARRVTCASETQVSVENTPIGQFAVYGTSKDSLLKPMDCHGAKANSLSHFSPQYKINQTAIFRTPGSGFEGHLVFRATIVEDVNTYWTEQYSRILMDPRISQPPKCSATCTYSNIITLIALLALSLYSQIL